MLTTRDPLAEEKKYLKKNLRAIREEFPGKYVVIKGQTVYGGYETFNDGVDAGLRRFATGEAFLVRSVLEPDDPDPLSIPVLALALGVPIVSHV